MISEPMVRTAQTVLLTFKRTENELPLEPRHLGVPSGASETIFRAYGTFGANRAPILHQY